MYNAMRYLFSALKIHFFIIEQNLYFSFIIPY